MLFNGKHINYKNYEEKSLLLGLFFIGVTFTGAAQLTAEKYWIKKDQTDGLAGNRVNDVLIEDLSNIWIGTSSGLSHFDGLNFTNYTTSNSTLADNVVLKLVLGQSLVWMLTNSGITSFDGTNFVNYTTLNGLPAGVRDIAITSTDTLWVCSNSGTAKFDGLSFVNNPFARGNSIAVDTMDRVYVLRGATIANYPFAELYENGVWSRPSPTGITGQTPGQKLKLTKDGSLYVVGNINDDTYTKIDYPLAVSFQSVRLNGMASPAPLYRDIDLNVFDIKDGKVWTGSSRSSLVCTGQDSTLMPLIVDDIMATSTAVDLFQDLLVVGSDVGLFYVDASVEPVNYEEEFSINQIRTVVNNYDPLFMDAKRGEANFEFPKGSGNHGIFAANLIVAAKNSNQNTFNVHPITPFISTFSPGSVSDAAGQKDVFIAKVSRQQIQNHQLNYNQAGYTMPNGIKNWPAIAVGVSGTATDLAPFVDANNNGCYDPDMGDYPAIKGDEAIYWINHPANGMKLEYHWMLYGYDAPNDSALNQSVFLQHTMINRDSVAFDSIKVGMYLDTDLGNPADDYVGCDSLNNIFYTYNGDVFDNGVSGNPGYGNNTPAVGVKFLSDSMESFIYYNNGPGNNGDPQIAAHWINYLESKWKNNQAVRYGGDGFNGPGVTTSPTAYIFTGDPYTQVGWSEVAPGVGLNSNPPGDRRSVASMPYFSLQVNQRKTIEMAIGYGQTSDTTSIVGQNVSEMIRLLNKVERFWDTLSIPSSIVASTDSCFLVTSIEEVEQSKNESLKVYPIPTTNQLTIQADSKIIEVQLYDTKGTQVRLLRASQNRVNLELGDYNEGFYFLRVKTAESSWKTRKIVLLR